MDWIEAEEGEEPVRVLSPTPWDDLIRRGHPNPDIQAIVTAAKDLQAAYSYSPDSLKDKYPDAPPLYRLFFQESYDDDRVVGTKKRENVKINELLYTLMAEKLQPNSAAFHTRLLAYIDDWLDTSKQGWLRPPPDVGRPPSYEWIDDRR